MKINRRFMLWFFVAVLSCAAVFAGCGGSSDNDNTPSAQDEESGGRESIGDDWEDLGFEMLSGAWKIDSTEMTLGNGVKLETSTALLPFIMNATSAGELSFTSLFRQTARSIPATFTGQNTDGQTITASDMTLVAGGTYTANNSSTYYQSMQGENFVETFFIELSKSSSASAQYDIMTFMNTRAVANQVGSVQNYDLTTVLHKISESDPELEMVSGNWEIVSVDLTEGLASELTDSDKTGFFSLNEDSIGEFTTNALTGEFMRLERDMGSDSDAAYQYTGEVTVPPIFPLTGYTKVSNGVFETSYVRDSNNQLDHERVEFLNNSWQTIRYTHRHCNSARSLEYMVRTTLRWR